MSASTTKDRVTRGNVQNNIVGAVETDVVCTCATLMVVATMLADERKLGCHRSP